MTTFPWATVTDDSPLRIQLDGDAEPLPITPDTLVADLAVGDRVRVLMDGGVTILGRAGGHP